jgi:predicted nucleic acid-binding Zn ribbon protein
VSGPEQPSGRRRRWGPAPGAPDGPRRLAESLGALMAPLGGSEAATAATIFARWEELAGLGLGEHATPVRLRDGVLVVAVDQPAWATQLRLLGPQLLTRIAELTGERPDRLEIRVRSG